MEPARSCFPLVLLFHTAIYVYVRTFAVYTACLAVNADRQTDRQTGNDYWTFCENISSFAASLIFFIFLRGRLILFRKYLFISLLIYF